MGSTRFDELNERMLLQVLEINPDSATVFGKHDPYDRMLPHGGLERPKKNLALLAGWSKEAHELASAENLSHKQVVSLGVLDYTLANYRFVIEDYPFWRLQPDALEVPGLAMLMMLMRQYAPLPKRLETLSWRIGEFPRYLSQFRARFAGASTAKLWTKFALESCRGLPSFFHSIEAMARGIPDPALHSRMRMNIEGAEEDLREHEQWLLKRLDGAIEDYAMGRTNYTKLMKIRKIPFSPDEMVALAENYLERLGRQRTQVAAKIAGGGSVDQARKIIEDDNPGTIEGVVERTRDEVEKARKFMIEEDLATVPLGSEVHVMVTPEFLESQTPTAQTVLPAVFERVQETIFLVTKGKSKEHMMSIWNNPAIVNTAVHEAFPGHHHQGVLSNRNPWMHQLPHIMYSAETLVPPYESQEGWAHYCEVMMHEKGFCGSEMDEFVMLDYAIWRACRVISDVGLSCGESNPDEMIERFTNLMGWPRIAVEAEVKGFSRMPGYGMCYLIGRHLVTRLKEDLMSKLGPKFSEKRFHDLVASNGNLPYYLLEEEVRAGIIG